MTRRGYSYYIMPALAAAAALFGVIWGWIGLTAAVHGGGMVALLLVIFGFGGIVLALALWRSWRGPRQ
jgi:hypothetical protein